MKKVVLNLSLIFLSALTATAQYYTFTQQSQSYQSISNPQFVISDSTQLDTSAAMVTVNYNSLQAKAFGENLSGLMQAGPDGSLVAIGNSSDFIFDPFFTGLRALGTSEFRANELIQGTDTIFEMEWFEFGLEGAPNTDFISMKLRFYLTKELIEFYFGPSHINPSHSFSVGPFCGIFHATKGFGSYKAVMVLNGSPSSPTITTTSVGTLNTFPANGTTYRFSGPQVTSIGELKEEKLNLNLYPNPSNGLINIDSKKEIQDITIYNSVGQQVYKKESIETGRLQLSLSLSPGAYTVISTFTDGSLMNSKQLYIEE